MSTSADTQALLTATMAALAAGPFRCWLVGGSVRDRELGRSSHDVDVVVSGASPGQESSRKAAATLAEAVAHNLGLPYFTLSHDFGAHRVVASTARLDVTALRGGSIEADLGLRDFTVNAMAVPLGGGGLVDPFGGRTHAASRTLAAVSDRIFAEDSVRLVRAVRFVHALGFHADEHLAGLIRREAWRIRGAAPERVAAELVAGLEVGLEVSETAELVCLMRDTGLLAELFPEVEALARIRDGHGGTEFQVLLVRLSHLDSLLDGPCEPVFQAPEVMERLGLPIDGTMSRVAGLRLAGLLLHAGRSAAGRTGSEDGSPYPGEWDLSRCVVRDVCARLRLSSRVRSLLLACVEGAERLEKLERAITESTRGTAIKRDLVRCLGAVEPWAPEVSMLVEAEVRATGRTGPRSAAARLIDLWVEWQRRGAPAMPFDGTSLALNLGIEPGPLLGRVLEEVRVAVQAGEVTGFDAALAYGRGVLENLRG